MILPKLICSFFFSCESVLYEILSSLRSATTDAASSSSAFPTISATKSVTELLSEAAPLADAVGFCLHYFLQNTLFCLVYPLLVTQEPLFEDDTTDKNDGIGHDEAANVQGKLNGQIEDCCSYSRPGTYRIHGFLMFHLFCRY